MQPQYTTAQAERFWALVDKSPDEDACWPWRGSRHAQGYGLFSVYNRLRGGNRPQRAHRVAWILSYGPIPRGQFCCHRCDVPACCNPRHLFLGSHRDNMADRWAKERSRACGCRHRSGQGLSRADSEAIRALYAAGTITHVALAERFGISQPHVSMIIRGKRGSPWP